MSNRDCLCLFLRFLVNPENPAFRCLLSLDLLFDEQFKAVFQCSVPISNVACDPYFFYVGGFLLFQETADFFFVVFTRFSVHVLIIFKKCLK